MSKGKQSRDPRSCGDECRASPREGIWVGAKGGWVDSTQAGAGASGEGEAWQDVGAQQRSVAWGAVGMVVAAHRQGPARGPLKQGRCITASVQNEVSSAWSLM